MRRAANVNGAVPCSRTGPVLPAGRTGPFNSVIRHPFRLSLLSALLPFLLAVLSPAVAQVNTEAFRGHPDEEGFRNSIAVNFSFYDGNSEFFKVNGRYRGDLSFGRFYSFLVLNYNYGEEANDIFLRDGFAHLRGVYAIAGPLQGEAFAQRGFNEFIRLKDRFLLGGGARIRLAESDDSVRSIALYMGIGGMYENELEGDDAAERRELFRSTNYLSASVKFHHRFGVNLVTYYQPEATRFNDYRILLEAGLGFDLFSGLMITTGLNWRYDSRPFPGVESYDLALSNGLTLTF